VLVLAQRTRVQPAPPHSYGISPPRQRSRACDVRETADFSNISNVYYVKSMTGQGNLLWIPWPSIPMLAK
jgi:hypothetical protein